MIGGRPFYPFEHFDKVSWCVIWWMAVKYDRCVIVSLATTNAIAKFTRRERGWGWRGVEGWAAWFGMDRSSNTLLQSVMSTQTHTDRERERQVESLPLRVKKPTPVNSVILITPPLPAVGEGREKKYTTVLITTLWFSNNDEKQGKRFIIYKSDVGVGSAHRQRRGVIKNYIPTWNRQLRILYRKILRIIYGRIKGPV